MWHNSFDFIQSLFYRKLRWCRLPWWGIWWLLSIKVLLIQKIEAFTAATKVTREMMGKWKTSCNVLMPTFSSRLVILCDCETCNLCTSVGRESFPISVPYTQPNGGKADTHGQKRNKKTGNVPLAIELSSFFVGVLLAVEQRTIIKLGASRKREGNVASRPNVRPRPSERQAQAAHSTILPLQLPPKCGTMPLYDDLSLESWVLSRHELTFPFWECCIAILHALYMDFATDW